MTTFHNYSPESPHHILYLGDSGDGKTGSTVALAAMGYEVFNYDLDNGQEILYDFLTSPKSIYRHEKRTSDAQILWTKEQAETILDRYHFKTIIEKFNIQGDKAVPRGEAWNEVHMAMNAWIEDAPDGEKKNYGNISTWDTSRIVIIDSFSRYNDFAKNYHLKLNMRSGQGLRVGVAESNDYSAIYNMILPQMDLFKSLSCHVIMICHIQYLDAMLGVPQTDPKARRDKTGYAQTIGPKIAPMIGQYFNHTIRAKRIGTGPATKRVILTQVDDSVGLKTPAPLRVKREYPIETGLAEYFRDLKGAPL